MKQFKKYTAALVGLVIAVSTFSTSAAELKGAEKMAGVDKKPTPAMKQDGKTFQSHVKQIGDIGPKQVFSIKVQSFHGPTLSSALLYDTNTGDILLLGTSVGNGLAPSLIGAGAQVGSAYLWGASIRPSRTSVNNNSGSSSKGGSSVSVSDSDSEGGDAVSVSSSKSDADADADSYSKSDADSFSKSDADVRNSNSNSNVNRNDNDVRNSNKNVNSNSNSQSQGQGQIQGQQQGQQQNNQNTQTQNNNNKNHNNGGKKDK